MDGDEGRLDGEMKKKWEQTWLGDVWRFLCVAESIRPCLFVLFLLLLFLTCPGHWQDTRRLRRKNPTPTTQNPSDFPCSIPQLSSSIPLSHRSQMSLAPFSPCSPPSMLFSLNPSVSLVSHIAVIPASFPSFPSSLRSAVCTPVPSLTLIFSPSLLLSHLSPIINNDQIFLSFILSVFSVSF